MGKGRRRSAEVLRKEEGKEGTCLVDDEVLERNLSVSNLVAHLGEVVVNLEDADLGSFSREDVVEHEPDDRRKESRQISSREGDEEGTRGLTSKRSSINHSTPSSSCRDP